MSLAFTAPDKADMFEFLEEKVWYKFETQTDLFDAWATANSSNANVDKYDGRALTFMFSTTFISGWDALPLGFVKKWSGGCLKDHSSGMGGFCLLEDNDTAVELTTNTLTNVWDASDTTIVLNDSTNRAVLTFRLSDSDFDSLETAWTDVA